MRLPTARLRASFVLLALVAGCGAADPPEPDRVRTASGGVIFGCPGKDLQNDKNNCGSCGNVCAPGYFCGNGHCTDVIRGNWCGGDGDCPKTSGWQERCVAGSCDPAVIAACAEDKATCDNWQTLSCPCQKAFPHAYCIPNHYYSEYICCPTGYGFDHYNRNCLLPIH